MASAYHQPYIPRESRDLSSFFKHFFDSVECVRPRLCTNRFSEDNFNPEGLNGVLCYIDDIIVYGKSAAEHSANIQDVLRHISAACLRLNEKCFFNLQERTILGYVVSHKGLASLAPLKSKVDAVVHAPAPAKITELRSFLGLVNYYAKFIPHFNDFVQPLRQLLRQGAPLSWDNKTTQTFREVEQLLATCKAVHKFYPSLLPIVTADDFHYGLGDLLQQMYGNDLRSIAFASATLSQAERKYSVGEKEALACVWE